MKYASQLVTIYASVLLVCGAVLLFAPAEASAVVGAAGPVLFVQLLGAAFLGFAAANWIVRHSPLGGIYGRAVVLGNQVFSLAGALILLGHMPAVPGIGFWLLLGTLACGALLYGVFLVRGPRFDEPGV